MAVDSVTFNDRRISSIRKDLSSDPLYCESMGVYFFHLVLKVFLFENYLEIFWFSIFY